MRSQPELPSRNQIDKAGKYLRDVVSRKIPAHEVDLARMDAAIEVVTAFREAHAYPMQKVRNGLSSMIATEGIDAALTQRHKRVPRIIRKLIRMHGTALVRLEDIGGCRVVVESPQDMEALCRRVRKNWSSEFSRPPRDYVAEPKAMGYRARHFVVVRDGRAVEVQVRTQRQQRWADAVERLDSRFKLNLKDEDGPDLVKENFQIAGEVLYQLEWLDAVDEDLLERLRVSNATMISEGYYSG